MLNLTILALALTAGGLFGLIELGAPALVIALSLVLVAGPLSVLLTGVQD